VAGEGDATAEPSRLYTLWERRVDASIHGVAIIAGLVGAALLLAVAADHGSRGAVLAAGVYSVALLAMFACSAAYNIGRRSRHQGWLRNLDQAAIFVMIAGTYTPFTTMYPTGWWSLVLTAAVWTVAALGIVARLFRGRLFERISVPLYLSFGWLGLATAAPLVHAIDTHVLALLATGGVLYTAGVAFHLWERLPYQNAIWHGFVVVAAAAHYAAVSASFRSVALPL
jgi:hemolysin III